MRALAHLTLLSLLFATSAVQSDTLQPTSGMSSPSTTPTPSASSIIPPTSPTEMPPTTTTKSLSSITTPTEASSTAPTKSPSSTTTPTEASSTAPTKSPSSTTTPTEASSTAPTKSPSPTTAPTPPALSTPTVPVSSPVPDSTVTSTENKTNTTAATTPIAATNTSPPGSGNLGSTAPSPTSNGSTITPGTQNNSSETLTPVTSGNITLSTISTSNSGPTVPISPCQGAPCQDGSSCVSLNNTHFCLCSLGYYYKSFTCRKGKLFPGTITVRVSETSGLEDGNSVAYQNLHFQITDFFKSIFANSDYGQTVIDKVSISSSARSEMRAGDSAVVVEVLNIFAETTKENETTVSESITNATHNGTSGMKYHARSLCDYYGCEPEEDHCSNNLLCKCKQGMERPNAQVPVCVASAVRCPDTCSADHNKQCLVNKNTGKPECVCLPGYKESDGGICQECAFGYSGVHCEDQFQLILTVVGSIGGALILCLMIALIVLSSSKNKNKNIEEENLIENDFQNLRLQQTTTGFSNPGANGSIFPKVKANVPGQPQNPYVHQRSLPRPDY
ncbi:mucin-13 isoform X1 [Mustela lutreola]|uniref:mucin-13 isoform X1 n=1 Tax=Mustela lutreola TaxID=9666 RepID=UPI002797B7D1|nr:mucin-13 isoform X1 [Mustela lutreola]XP_059018913.1 mucin-13 isoform X1 [Mustela lutreola]